MTVLLTGIVDASTTPLLRAVLDGVYAGRPELVILDLSGVAFLARSALATLVATRRRLAAQQAALSVRRPSPAAVSVLRGSGLVRMLESP